MTHDVVSDPLVTVPVDVDVDDRLAGPVTFRMAGWLAAAAAGVAAMAFGHGSVFLTVVGMVLLLAGGTGAFVRPAGRPVAAWLGPLLAYHRRQRRARQARHD